MKFSFHNLPLKKKLIFITLLPIIVVSTIFLSVILVNQINVQRASMIQQAGSLTSILANNINAAVLFKDERRARHLLASLRLEPLILYARAQSSDLNFTVEYHRSSTLEDVESTISNADYSPDQFGLFSQYLVTSHVVEADSDQIGMLVLVSDTSGFRTSLSNLLVLGSTLILVSAIIAFKFAQHFHRSVTDPIIHLRNAMRTISQKHDYRIRIGNHDEENMRDLYHGFDHMLDQIQYRDAELSRHQATLEKQIQLRVDEIEIINRKRISWLENMAFFLHHELRNKIVGFKSTMDIIERKTEHGGLEKYLARARKSATLMNHLLESVGNASDLEATLWSESKTLLNLSNLLDEQVDEYAISHPQMQFNKNIRKDIKVQGNHSRLLQACDKLVTNAIEHSLFQSTITVRLHERDGYAELDIINLGDPLPEDRESMFQLFVSSKLHSGNNRGLGLFVVKLIAENHSGDIRAEPLEEQSGVKFSLRIPLYPTLDDPK